MRRSSVFVGFLGLVCGAGSARAQQDAWPMYQGDASHSGHLPVALDPTSIGIHWEVDFNMAGLNPVAAADGKVFVSGAGLSGRKLFALDKEDGSVLWEEDMGQPHSINPPSYADGMVYMQTCNHSGDTWVWGFDANTGTPLIKTPTSAQWESYLAPTIYDGSVYVNGGYYGGMYGIDGTTGAELWWIGLAQYDRWTPAVDEQHCYAYVGGTLSVVNRFTGSLVYQVLDPDFDWSGWSMHQAPILGGMDDLIATNASFSVGRLISFDLGTKSIRFSLDEGFSGQPAVTGGAIYAINAGSLDVRSELDGSVLWKWIPIGGQLQGNVIVTESHALVHTATETHLIDLSTHLSVWSYPAGGHVALGEGNLYIVQGDGTLTALSYEISPKPLLAQPASAKYFELPPTVTLTGTGFAGGGETHVFFGADEATEVVVVDDHTITCKPSVSAPGAFAVVVQNDIGSGELDEPFLFTPAAAVTGETKLGGTLAISFDFEPHDSLIVLLGQAAPGGHPFGPWHGAFGLVSPTFVVGVLAWPFDDFTFLVELPNDPSMVGTACSIQGLAGELLQSRGAWTNVETIVIGGDVP